MFDLVMFIFRIKQKNTPKKTQLCALLKNSTIGIRTIGVRTSWGTPVSKIIAPFICLIYLHKIMKIMLAQKPPMNPVGKNFDPQNPNEQN